MPTYIAANNASTTVAAQLLVGGTSLTVASGAAFPTITGSDWTYITLANASDPSIVEIVKVTAHAAASATFTIERAQEGTSAIQWEIGDTVELRGTAGTLVTVDGTQTLTNKTLTSPTLTTPALGVATATTVNKVTVTAPATGATLTIQDGFTLTVNGNATVSGTNTGDQTNISGNAATVTVADAGGDTTTWPLLGTSQTGSLSPATDVGLTYDATTKTLTTTTFVGALTGTASGNLTSGGALGTPSSGTLTNCSGLPATGLVADTTTAVGFGTIELGHASDTTLSRSSAGVLAVEGNTIPMNGTAQTATFGTIELGHASDTTLSRSAAGVLAVEGVVIPSISSTNTLTNKRVTLRTGSTTSSATPTINTDNYDVYQLTAQAADITSFTTNLSGTPTDGDGLIIEITGTAARAITWGASFEASTVALPTTTVSTDKLTVGFIWNSATSKWRCIASV